VGRSFLRAITAGADLTAVVGALGLALFICLSAGASRARAEQKLSLEEASFLLETDGEPQPEAIRSLAERGGALGVSSLLRVMDRVGPEERRVIAEGFRGDHAGQGRVLDALFRLAQDEAPPVREAAIESLQKSSSAGGGMMLLRLLEVARPDREALAGAVRRFAEARRSESSAKGSDTDAETIAFEENATRALTPLLDDPSPKVRYAAVEALDALTHPRAGDLLLSSLDDPDEDTNYRARSALVERREARFLEPLLSFAGSLTSDKERRDLYSRIAYQYCAREAPRFFEMFRAAASSAEKEDFRHLVGSCRVPLEPEVSDALKRYRSDPRREIRERASAILGWAREEEEEWKHAGPWVQRHFLLLTSGMAAFLGCLLFVWAFRLLKLRSVLEGTGLSKARSVALGTVAVSGDAQPEKGYLKHPLTGEICVWYQGADPNHRFYVEDETGRLLVEPHQAVLLSEDGLVSPGERIHIVATARRSFDKDAAPDERRVVLGTREGPRPLQQRVVDLLVGGLLGVVAGNRSVRRLFDNAQDVFWIWDDARRRPMSSPGEVALIFSVALFAGAWMVIFFLTSAAALGVELVR